VSPAQIHLVASAAPIEGRGHSARALALAEAFADRGVHPTLELRRGSLTERQAAGFARFGVRSAVGPPGAVVVADLPDPNEDAGGVTDRLVVFDDRDVFAGDAAIVVQPSLPRWTGRPGAHAARVLAGYDYVPIAGEIRAARAVIRTDLSARRVVVCFGGSDPEDVTGRLGAALLDLPSADTVVIVGPDYGGAFAAPGAEVLRDPPGFVDLLASADLVVGSAGTMKFELAALGRAMILVAAADNQAAVGEAFAATGAARYLGDGRTIDAAVVRVAALDLLGDDPGRAALGARGSALIDGSGAARIVDAALALARTAG
jgi:spore coat polysaccharide biosynthesis predicted glycosyltransferase SpsG